MKLFPAYYQHNLTTQARNHLDEPAPSLHLLDEDDASNARIQ